jgi:serine/threonine protein kinase
MWCGDAMVKHQLLSAEQDAELTALVQRFLHPADIEGYILSAELGRGGMGVVYKALQLSLERTVAIKVLLPKFALSPHFRERFLTEARAVGRVNHQNVISCYDVAEDRGLIFMVMELMTGGDLKARVRGAQGGVLDLEDALKLVAGAADGLQAIHDEGLLHRDLKPSNIFVTESGVPKIADLGLVLSNDGGTGQASRPVGTPAFMPPEQAAMQQLSPSSDVYALGATLYYALCGRAPFSGQSIDDILEQVRTGSPMPLVQLNPQVPMSVNNVIIRAMSRDPSLRTQTAAELAHELRDLLENKATFHLGGANVIDVALDEDGSFSGDETIISDGSSSGMQSSAIFAAPVESAIIESGGDGDGAMPCPRCGQAVAPYASLCNCGFDMDAWRKKNEEDQHRQVMEQQAQELEDRIRREEIARVHREESEEVERRRTGFFSRLKRRK